MDSSYSMPGSFPLPSNTSWSARSPPPAPPVAESSTQVTFERKELIGTKTHAQRHLIGQLNSLTYFVIGYQFVKYCYSSCLPPLFFHALIQQLLNTEEITGNGQGTRVLFNEAIALQERHAEANGILYNRTAWVNLLLSKLCLFVYWKFLVVAAWHTVFVVGWVQLVANNGQLEDLSFGTWYCLSFMGETTPSNYSVLDPWWLRLWKLGLVELLITDVIILALQLCLFQSIYFQSTISPKGIALGEEEVYILRAQSGGAQGSVPLDHRGLPDVLHIKLFQMFDRESFSRS